MTVRKRLDNELVRRELVSNRTQAREAILANRVQVNGSIASKPAHMVSVQETIKLVGHPPRFVSRGGEKLDAALTKFGIDVTEQRALDVGASTGGFTDCLLQRGASSVVSVDVGYGQIHERLRVDPRVSLFERVNIRYVEPEEFGSLPDIIVVDVSFISLKKIIATLRKFFHRDTRLICLVKPQFEAQRNEVSKGKGIISDPEIWRRVLMEVTESFILEGIDVSDYMVSPLSGADGNREFLIDCTLKTKSVDEVQIPDITSKNNDVKPEIEVPIDLNIANKIETVPGYVQLSEYHCNQINEVIYSLIV